MHEFMNFIENIWTNQYFQAFLIVLGFFFASKLLSYVSKNYLKKWSSKTKTILDDLIVDKLKAPFTYILVLIGLQIAISSLDTGFFWIESAVRSITALFSIYIAITIFQIIVEFSVDIYHKRNPSKMIDSLIPLFRKTGKVVLIIAGLIWILHIWDINIGPLLAGAGIAGFVIGFAMQDTLKNIFGGISMILDKTLEVGDRISLNNGEMGFVEEVTIRSTKVRTFNNELLTIPNGQLADSQIKNFTKPSLSLRVVIDFSVVYGSDLDKVKKIVEETVSNIDGISNEPPVSAIMTEMANSGLNWQLRFWVSDQSTAFDKRIEAVSKIYKALTDNNISIPYPTQTLYLKKDND